MVRTLPKSKGFTLLELLIVVGILGVLAAVGVLAYRHYVRKSYTSEVYSMIASIKQAEESYKAETSAYLSASTSEDDFYPVLRSAGSEPTKKPFDPASKPNWKALGITSFSKYLYCGYAVVAGPADALPAGARGATLFGGVAPKVEWYYIRAACDLDGDAAKDSYFETTFDRQTVYIDNEGH